MDSAADRHERLRTLLAENYRRRHRPELVRDLAAALGAEPAPDDFLDLTATEALWEGVASQAKYHAVWHRIWGDRLAGEVARTLRDLADRLEGIDAYLLRRNPPEAVRAPVSPLLRNEADHVSRRTDLTLVTADAASGLVLGWDHLPYADEYSLLAWGELAFALTDPVAR